MKERNYLEDMLVPLFGIMISTHVLGWLINPWYLIVSNLSMIPVIIITFRKPKVIEGEKE